MLGRQHHPRFLAAAVFTSLSATVVNAMLNKNGLPLPMSFSSSPHVTILFKQWTTSSTQGYSITLVTCFALGTVSILLRLLRAWISYNMNTLEYSTLTSCSADSRCCSNGTTCNTSERILSLSDVFRRGPWHILVHVCKRSVWKGFPFLNNSIRSFVTFLVYGLDYLLMLIAMTFNVGVFLCLMCGMAFAYIFVGHYFSGGMKLLHAVAEECITTGKPANFTIDKSCVSGSKSNENDGVVLGYCDCPCVQNGPHCGCLVGGVCHCPRNPLSPRTE